MPKPSIYTWLTSVSAEKVRRVLRHKGADFEWVEVYFHDRSRVEEVSGQRQVPIVEYAGQVVGPSTWELIVWAEETFPGPTLFPDNTLAICKMIDTYVDKVLMDLSLRAFLPWMLPTLTFGDERRRRVENLLLGRGLISESYEELIDEQYKGYPQLTVDYLPHLRLLDSHFSSRQYLVGDAMTAADHILYATHWQMLNNDTWMRVYEDFELKHLDRWAEAQKAFYFTNIRNCG